jgi:hypothetical protein
MYYHFSFCITLLVLVLVFFLNLLPYLGVIVIFHIIHIKEVIIFQLIRKMANRNAKDDGWSFFVYTQPEAEKEALQM